MSKNILQQLSSTLGIDRLWEEFTRDNSKWLMQKKKTMEEKSKKNKIELNKIKEKAGKEEKDFMSKWVTQWSPKDRKALFPNVTPAADPKSDVGGKLKQFLSPTPISYNPTIAPQSPEVTPPPDKAADPYYLKINEAAKTYGVPQDYLYRHIKAESNFNPNAGSPAGAQGIAQFMPSTAQGMGFDPMDPYASIENAAKYLKAKYDEFGSWDKAIAAYNAGSGNVRKYGGVPPFKETINHVRKVLGIK